MKLINTKNLDKKLVKKLKQSSLPLSLLILLLLGSVYFEINNSLDSFISNLTVPTIPKKLWDDMNSQIQPGKLNMDGYDWFTFYDPKLKVKTRVKLSGLSPSHFESLGNKSHRIRFDGNNIRLKSFSSELMQVPKNDTRYAFLQEMASYNIAKPFYKYAPGAGLVTLNNERDNVYILWDETFENNVRENTFVGWSTLAKNSIHARDKQERYFHISWKTRNTTMDNLVEKFTDLLNPIFDAISLPPNKFTESKFDEDPYITYLAISKIFGSGHMDAHNLLFIPKKSGDNVTWHMGLYDMAGLRYYTQDSLLQIFNPITQYFLRNPRTAHTYLKRLNDLNTDILKGGRISSFYNKFSCEKASKYAGFSEFLQKNIYPNTTVMDLNSFCQLHSKMSDYEKVRSLYLDHKFMQATAHWRLFKSDSKIYLGINIPSPVGVEIKSVKCSRKKCINKFKLVNKPWWQDNNDWLLLPELVRDSPKWKGKLHSSQFTYLYEWLGRSPIYPEDIKISAVNAVTEKKVHAIKTIYPTFDIKVDKNTDPDKENVFDVTLNIINPMDVERDYKMHIANLEEVDDPIKGTKPWRYKITSRCKISKNGNLKHIFNCSKIDYSKWPYPLNYSVELYYKGFLTQKLHGEVYINPKPIKDSKILSNENVSAFLLDTDEKLQLNETLSSIPLEDVEKIYEVIEKSDEIYLIPAAETFVVNDDLTLPKNSVLIMQDKSQLKVWPLVNIKVGSIISTAATEKSAVITGHRGLGSWGQLHIAEYAYLNNTTIKQYSNEHGGIYAENINMQITNSILNGKSNITCNNCSIKLANVTINAGQWGLKAKDSMIDIENIIVSNSEHVFILEDCVGNVRNVSLNQEKTNGTNVDRVFEIIGPASDITISDITANKVNIFLSKYLHPKVVFSNISLANTNKHTLDFDSEEVYEPIIEMSADDFANEYKFLKLKRDKNEKGKFYFTNKTYKINEDILVPKTVTLVIEPGAKLLFGKGDSLITYGKVIAEGTEENPITITAQEKRWGVFALRGTGASGSFKYVNISKGKENYLTGTEYTGALSAHSGATLVVENSTFEKNKGDDAINCKNSYCKITNSSFIENDFDGVDFDFSEGEISNNVFEKNGNDGIDTSFDNSKIFENKIIKSGDKGISIGEHSYPTIYNNLIEENKIGIEVKDDSKVFVINNRINNNKIGINTYQKKRAFGGGGKAIVVNTILESNEETSKSDRWTSVEVLDMPGITNVDEIIEIINDQDELEEQPWN